MGIVRRKEVERNRKRERRKVGGKEEEKREKGVKEGERRE